MHNKSELNTANVRCIVIQVFALPDMQLVFDHCPVTEGLQTLSGDPDAEALVDKDPIEEDGQGDGDPESVTARPVVVEMRMESFSQAAEQTQDDKQR